MLLATVDGRNAGHSLGVSTIELANILLSFGAYNALNLDGGGSTTMVMADSTPRVVNVPVGVNNVPGSERSNGNNLGVFAQPNPRNVSRYVYADFDLGDQDQFAPRGNRFKRHQRHSRQFNDRRLPVRREKPWMGATAQWRLPARAQRTTLGSLMTQSGSGLAPQPKA